MTQKNQDKTTLEIAQAVVAKISDGYELACRVCDRPDNAGRRYIKEQYTTDSSSSIRSPSREWPNSEFKHAMTRKYAKQLVDKLSH